MVMAFPWRCATRNTVWRFEPSMGRARLARGADLFGARGGTAMHHAINVTRCSCIFQPDAGVVDVSLPNANGIELTRTIRSCAPETAVLVLSRYDESVYAGAESKDHRYVGP